MLKTRIITALVLLAVILPILYSASFIAFSIVGVVFFMAAAWESNRLFKNPYPLSLALLATLIFLYLNYAQLEHIQTMRLLCILSVLSWAAVFIPSLKFGLPKFGGSLNLILGGLYVVSILASFIAINALFLHSPKFLLSAMALVWIADIGAYFSGKALGRNKLAPSISPGKSWEGAIGGWLLVIILSVVSTFFTSFSDTLPTVFLTKFGWTISILLLSLLSVASVCGDLFESLLKRRAEMKDSSKLLPGHGGVLDRIDALIPVLPFIVLISAGR